MSRILLVFILMDEYSLHMFVFIPLLLPRDGNRASIERLFHAFTHGINSDLTTKCVSSVPIDVAEEQFGT